MTLEILSEPLSVCRLASMDGVDWKRELTFFSRTDQELSLVCPTGAVPPDALAREDGWRALRAAGVLDFSLVGVLAGLTGALAARGIGLFAISTYNTDYLLVRAERLADALRALRDAGYEVPEEENGWPESI